MSNREKIEDIQTQLLQDFFETQMMQRYQNSWKAEVYAVALRKRNTKYSTYAQMADKFNAKGVGGIAVTDFDVTALNSLIRFDFPSVCCPRMDTNRKIGHIALDRNGFSHISNFRDTQHIYQLEDTAVKHMEELLTHLQSIGWNYPLIIRKYLGTGYNDGLLNEISQLVASERNEETERESVILHYLQELWLSRQERKGQYVALSYNLDGKWDDKKLLDELIDTNLVNEQTGMRIVAEGGYGKSWTLYEIAGRYAKAYLENATDEQLAIPIVIELGKLYKDCSSIGKRIAQLFFKGDESKVLDFYNVNKIILFIDAMDEAKSDIRSDVSRELAFMHGRYPNILFVCASRKSCIDKYPISIPCYAIKELDDGQIMEYIEKVIPENLVEQSKEDWIGEHRKEFLSKNRTPFYISCYVDLICETGDHDFVDTTQLIEKFLNAIIEREINKTGFQSDKMTFINFLIELCRLLDAESADGGKVTALPENDIIRELSARIAVEEGQASIKAVGRKLVEIQVLERDDEGMLLSFAHQNYREYINRKYPARSFRRWS